MVSRFGKTCVLNLLAFLALTDTAAAVVAVRGGGYQNIVVTFSPDVKRDDQSNVLLATKDLLTAVSHVVHKATGIHFGEVVFLLPYTWGKLEDWSHDGATYSSANEVYHDANIFMESSSDTVYGTQPHTLERGGCGIEGVRISIPIDFLDFNSSSEDGNAKAKLMAREWIRYRYGIFYENGYLNDDRYPLYFGTPGSDEPADIQITGCTNKPVKYSFKDSRGEECSLVVDKSGRPDKNSRCYFRPEDGNNSDVLSSLMYVQDLTSVVYLCDDENHVHNADALNKQNSLCKGRSIWSVMKNHPDFKNRGNSSDLFQQPKFKVILDRNPRIVLAVDSSQTIGLNTKRVIRKAVQKFLFDLPEETEFSLLRFDSTVITKIPFGLLDKRSVEPFVFNGDKSSCPQCAVKKGFQVLTDDNSNSKGTIIILSSADSATGDADLVEKLKSSQICLSVVVLDGSNSSNAGLKELLDTSPCSHLWVMPALEHGDPLDALVKLNEQFELVIKLHTYHNAKYTVETKQIVDTSPVSFKTDRGIQGFQIWLTNVNDQLTHSFEDNDVVLENGNGADFSCQKAEERSDFRVYQVSTEKGNNWSFRIGKVDPSENAFPILLQVVAKESNSEAIRVQSWIQDVTPYEGSGNQEQMPVVLYAEVTMGINPVLYAKVEASIVTPDQSTFPLHLLDNGLGDPDVTQNDGIYSRYFTQFTSKGDYHVTFTISDNEGQSRTAQSPPMEYGPAVPCCGSFVPTGPKQDTGPFKRIIYKNFRARSGRPPNGYKPSRVQDLRMTSWDDTGKIVLTFTSPGNEVDNGAAAKYMFKLFTTKEDAERNFELENELMSGFKLLELVSPKEYPTEQTVEIQLSENITTGRDYFFAMRSESVTGRQSDTSNAVKIFIPAAIYSSLSPTSDSISTGDDGDDNGTSKQKTGHVDGKVIGIIVGVCVFLIIIFICAYVAFYVFVLRPRRKEDESEKSNKTPSQKRSTDAPKDAGDGTVSASEWQMESNSISPVNSWPSNILVNHHEKVKEAKRKKEKPPVFTIEKLENAPDEISTISNGLLPNPIYSSVAEDFDESNEHDYETHALSQQLQDQTAARPSRRVTHV